MNEDRLKRLKDLPAPTPRPAAKAAALAAALAAFDEKAGAPERTHPEKIAGAPQGNAASVRLMHASHLEPRRHSMRARYYRIAASAAVLAAAAPLVLFLTRNDWVAPGAPDAVEAPIPARPRQATPPVALPASAEREAPERDDAPEAGLAKADSPKADPQSPKAPPPPAPEPSLQASGEALPQARLIGGDLRAEAPSAALEQNRDRFPSATPGSVKQVAAEPVSTFSIDVDTASYAFLRRTLNSGRLPPVDAVRVEEMINYFPYDYPRPDGDQTPFQPTVTVTPAPWKPANQLVHIAIKGYDVPRAARPRANLVLLIDVSGSMAPPDRLPLLRNAFRLLVDRLQPDDTLGIVTYASGSAVVLEPTKIAEKSRILATIDRLEAGGSTAGAAGVQDAYRLAEAHFDKDAVNRVILATDGDFNVGVTDPEELKRLIERKRRSGVFLSVIGVGQDNYNDALMQTLAQNGNGAAVYVDTLNEARKALVEEASSTLFPIAKDVKIQVEFNPARVSEYRLIGYETRALRREDFNNDKVDAGEVGSGHAVTAIYEVTPAGAPGATDALRYQKSDAKPDAAPSSESELAFLKLRYKLPQEETSRLISLPITEAMEKSLADTPDDVRFSIAVAGFGQLLRDLPYLGSFGYDDVITLAQGARGADPFGYRAEFMTLARLAKLARRD